MSRLKFAGASVLLGAYLGLSSQALAAPLTDYKITAKLSPYRDAEREVVEDAESKTAGANANDLPVKAEMITIQSVHKLPRFQIFLKVWIQITNVAGATPKDTLSNRLIEADPVDSPFRITPLDHVLSLELTERMTSLRVFVRISKDELVERWLHIKIEDRKPLIFTHPTCLSLGYKLTPLEKGGDYLFAALSCVLQTPDDEEEAKKQDAKRVFAVLGYSKDAEIQVKRFQTFAEMGSQYVLIDLQRLDPTTPVDITVRRKNTFSGSNLRLEIIKPVLNENWVLQLGAGVVDHSFEGTGASENQLNFAFRFRANRWPEKSLKVTEVTFEGLFSPFALLKSNTNVEGATYATVGLEADFPLPLCPFELLDLSCKLGVGGRAFVMSVSGQTYGFNEAMIGPSAHLLLRPMEVEGKENHWGYVRYAPLFSSSSPFSLGQAEISVGFVRDITPDSVADNDRRVYFSTDFQILSAKVNAATQTAWSLQGLFLFDVGGF